MSRNDSYEVRARELALENGLDPDTRVPHPTKAGRTMPVWCQYRDQARAEHLAQQVAANKPAPQKPEYQNSPLTILGQHEHSTIEQMKHCMSYGNVVAGVLCADGHLGYAQPVGGVIAYEDQISISGVGFDIGCGNLAVRLDTRFDDIRDRLHIIAQDIAKNISFGVGRTNNKKVTGPSVDAFFDDTNGWKESGMEDYKKKAWEQLGTVGSGNHYVDVFEDEEGYVWIGVHFGSRGLGHTTATRFIKLAGGKDGINVPPTLVDVKSELGRRYITAMSMAGLYAMLGREWVVEEVRKIIGGWVTDRVHNHHNYAFLEHHDGKDLWVVRKGATPAYPGKRGFVGGSMGDDAVIVQGIDSEEARKTFYSTVHGAGRVFGRKEAKRRFTREEMESWLRERGVLLIGGDLDESPMAYRRLDEVLAYHANSVKVLHRLKPRIVLMAGKNEFDPWKD